MSKKRVLFFTSGQGAGGVYRALALFKAFLRAGDKVDFRAAVISDYAYLLTDWQLPHIAGARNANRVEFLARWVKEFRPDIVISNYHVAAVQEALQPFPNVKAWLLLRQFKDLGEWLKPLNTLAWQKIIAIEPGIVEGAATIPNVLGLLEEVPPVLATWQDEIIERELAKSYLQGDSNPTNRPLAVIAHNGVSWGEMEQSLLDSEIKKKLDEYHVVAFSQDKQLPTITRPGHGVYRNSAPLARYFAGIDYLLAAPGYNTFWEWQKYGRYGARAEWLMMPRMFEDLRSRAGMGNATTSRLDGKGRSWLRQQPNGADVIAQMILQS